MRSPRLDTSSPANRARKGSHRRGATRRMPDLDPQSFQEPVLTTHRSMPGGSLPRRRRRRRDSISVRHIRGSALGSGTTGILPAAHPRTRPAASGVRYANPRRLDCRTFIIRRAPALNASSGPEVPLQAVQSKLHQRRTVCRGSQVSGLSLALPPAQPRGHSSTTSDAGNPRRRRPRLRFRPYTPARPSPLVQLFDDAP